VPALAVRCAEQAASDWQASHPAPVQPGRQMHPPWEASYCWKSLHAAAAPPTQGAAAAGGGPAAGHAVAAPPPSEA
jgi:hypothetical protein